LTSLGTGRAAVQEHPRSVGRYDIISTLGVGGMAQVFLAMQRGPASASRLVALKRLRSDIADDSQFLTMFADEARLALRLSHPNVVHTYDVVAEHDGLFIAMELLQGQALSRLLRRMGREKLPIHEHLWILTQVLAGLHHAHTLTDFDGTPLKIVHRDVSPSNVIVTYAGEVKLVDFGIAKASVARTATQAGVIKGKLGYAAPEQCLGSPVDARSDIFAVGVMLWEALAGRRRSVADTALAQIQARVRGEELAIEEVRPDVAPELAEITRRAVTIDREHRFQSALEMQQALEQYLHLQAPTTGKDAVGALMTLHFNDEMTSFRSSMEAYLRAKSKGDDRRGFQDDQPPSAAEAAPASLEPPSLSSSGTVPNGTLRRESEDEFVFKRKPPRPQTAIAVLFVVVFAAAFAISRAMTKKPPEPSLAARAAASAPPSASTSVEPAHAPGAAAAVTEVRLDISVVPKTAVVRLDGKSLKLPYSGFHPVGPEEHELTITAGGYVAERRAVVFARDLAVDVHLRPERGNARARSTATLEIAAQRPVKNASTATPPEAPERKATFSPTMEPGQDLRAPTSNTRSNRQIDEKDPYSP
jgi:eukaryotic-like serine/threonine-protein kinase